MDISVIITTYNQPEWLEKVLWGCAVQTFPHFEIIIADDGSGPETREAIERMRSQLPMPLRHVWHEDRGFRKCEILNRAIAAASGDYLIFLDGDCIPRRDFVDVHRRLAEPSRFVSGGHLRLPLSTSRLITAEDIITGRAMDWRWLRAHGVPFSRRLLRLALGPRTARLFDAVTPTRPTWNGGNSSGWRRDAIMVNGFDERMGHGGLDREFGERLENAGVRGKQARHRAIVIHLAHDRPYHSAQVLEQNRALRRETAAERRIRTPVGLDRHLQTSA